MTPHSIAVARTCLDGAERDSMTFPEIVKTLIAEGFESYAIDLRRGEAVYYRPDGDSVALPTHPAYGEVAAGFDQSAIQAAIRDAQQLAPGYTYRGFCERVKAAGCAAYFVSFVGRRAVYLGRTGEMHVEHFPQ